MRLKPTLLVSVALIQQLWGYTHVELGAGNHVSVGKNIGKELALLERTLDDIVAKHPEEVIFFYVNDNQLDSLTLAVNHLREYVSKELLHDITVEPLYGDLFTVDLEKVQPNSVHLKNPSGYLFVDPDCCYMFCTKPDPSLLRNKDSLRALVQKCSKITDDGGLFLSVTSNLKALKTKEIQDAFGQEITWEPAEAKFDYDLSYQLDPGRPQNIIEQPCEAVWILKFALKP